MEGETVSLNFSSESRRSRDSISILVVDDDITCLSIVAAILKKFKYEVVTVKHPNDALCALRIKGDAFDLVVSDVHMPDMNGFELQEAIAHEFRLPVVLMSADKKEGVVSKGMTSGAAFFISKPVSPDDLRDLWQFAAIKQKSQVVIEEAGDNLPEKITTNNCDEMPLSASTVNEGRHNKKDSKRKSPNKEESDEKRRNNTKSASTKKPKVIWTNALHNRFLEAIRSIGLDRSVPKKILEVMNVPGLTRENVASHLQKYRIFLRRVSDASYKINGADDKGLRSFVTDFASSETSHSDRLSKLQCQNPGNFPGANSVLFPNQRASSSSLTDQSGLGQHRLISITGNLFRPNVGHNANPIHQNGFQNSHLSVGLAQSNYQTSPLLQGLLSNDQGHIDSFDATILGSPRISPSISPEVSSQVMTSNVIPSLASPNFVHQMSQTNYVGYKISNIKHLAESGNRNLNSCNATISLQHHEFQNNDFNAAALPTDNMLNLDQLDRYLGASSCYVPDNTDEKRLSDVIPSDYQNLLLPSNLSLVGNLENEGLIHESEFNPMYDQPPFDILATQQPLEEIAFDNNFSNQVNIQNQAQQNGGENTASSSFYGGTNDWDNHFSSCDQVPNQVQGLTNTEEFGTCGDQFNQTFLSPNEGDDDFLESLLAFGPSGEDQIQTLEGI